MRVILCDLQKFSHDQYVRVIGEEAQFYEKVELSELPYTISALANEYKISDVKLCGGAFAEQIAEEIMTTYNLHYSNNFNLNVEVIE